MKKSLLVLSIVTVGLVVKAADDSKVRSGLMELQSAESQTQILFNEVTTPQQKERVRFIQQKLAQAENYLQQALNLPTNPTNPPSQGQNVELFRSDSCGSDLVGIVNPTTDCGRFSTTDKVWGIRVNGKCQDIDDTTAQNACRMYQNAGNTEAVKVYKSDSCSDSLSAIFSTYSNCDSVSDSGNNAWAIMVGNQCMDISDTTLKKSCNAFKGINSPNSVKLYHSDSCGSDLVAAIDSNTNCDSLAGLNKVWAIQINGQCQDISDLDVVPACQRFKP